MENGLRSGWRETPIDFSISSEEFVVNDMIFRSTFLIHTISSPPTNLVYMHLIQKERKFVRNKKGLTQLQQQNGEFVGQWIRSAM